VETFFGSPLRVLFIVRKNVTSGSTPAILARYMLNVQEVLRELAHMRAVELYVVDMEDHTLPDQVGRYARFVLGNVLLSYCVDPSQISLVSGADILMGFHGAGISHYFHLNPLRKQ